MYGIGIRISVYLQLIGTILIDVISPKLAAAMAPVNLWFFLAISIALCMTLWDSTADVVDHYIIIAMGNGISIILLLECENFDMIWKPALEYALVTISRIVLVCFWQVCVLMFWFFKLPASKQRQIQQQEDGEALCGPFGWLFTQMPLSTGTGFYKFEQVKAVFWFAVYCLLIRKNIFTLAATCFHILQFRRKYEFLHRQVPASWVLLLDYFFAIPLNELTIIVYGPPETRIQNLAGGAPRVFRYDESVRVRLLSHVLHRYCVPRAAAVSPQPPRPWQDLQPKEPHGLVLPPITYIVSGILYLANAIMTIEFTIIINRISEVNDVRSLGQLVALVVGVGGFCTLAVHLFRDLRENRLKSAQGEVCYEREWAPGDIHSMLTEVSETVDFPANEETSMEDPVEAAEEGRARSLGIESEVELAEPGAE
ncbi:hypothetical protein BDZ91DRAFT_852008 [Kalaharituber pfeilii]|nr:hypothetical protein BDZ91DRAFT_852008 [Kalaharituber pfeilii]